ncbi:MAG: YlxM family DNA-binding protein [Ruminococcus sp.]
MDKNIEISLLYDFYGQLLSDKQREAVSLYCNDDLSLSETAEIMGITRQGVRDLVKRSEAELFEFEEKLGLFRRFFEAQQSARLIMSLAKKLSCVTDDSQTLRIAEDIIKEAETLYEQEV